MLTHLRRVTPHERRRAFALAAVKRFDRWYYFDSDDGDRVFRDSDGAEMPDRRDAMEQELDLLRDLSHGLSAEGSTVLSCTVREAGEAVVYRVTMVVEGRSASAPPA